MQRRLDQFAAAPPANDAIGDRRHLTVIARLSYRVYEDLRSRTVG